MKNAALQLWNRLRPSGRRVLTLRDPFLTAPARPVVVKPRPEPVVATDRQLPMRARYDAVVEEMKQTYNLRIRKWRTSSSGCAWEVHYHDGTVARLIESPYPKGPMSCAIFLHEVGHHAIGLGRYKPRCLEEYHAWAWSLNAMRERGFNVTAAVEKRMAESLKYAIEKARRRGLKRLPAELVPYL